MTIETTQSKLNINTLKPHIHAHMLTRMMELMDAVSKSSSSSRDEDGVFLLYRMRVEVERRFGKPAGPLPTDSPPVQRSFINHSITYRNFYISKLTQAYSSVNLWISTTQLFR